MIRVRTGSRLHFGLFNAGGEAARRFGGVGLMIDEPGIELEAAPAPEWAATGPLAERVLGFAARVCAAWTGVPPEPLAFTVRRASPEHAGLGTGTQLGLAVARAIQLCSGVRETTASELARLSGRGERSALGVHGFLHGGFLIEAGQAMSGTLSPLAVRLPWPGDWRVLLVRPEGGAGVHGEAERAAFRQLAAGRSTDALTERLCRLALMGLVPAVLEADLMAFGVALHEFNARAGEWFAPLQGGIYAGPGVQEAVEWLRAQGVRGAGQSSWGPTVFAVVAADRASALCAEMTRRGGWQVQAVNGKNSGAEWQG